MDAISALLENFPLGNYKFESEKVLFQKLFLSHDLSVNHFQIYDIIALLSMRVFIIFQDCNCLYANKQGPVVQN